MSDTRALKNRDYLGDGVYIGESDHMIAIYTDDGYTITNLIWLEPEVLAALNRWILKRETQRACAHEWARRRDGRACHKCGFIEFGVTL